MKTIIHKAEDRGHADHGWLKANHSFSFAGYFNPSKIHFGALRVLNDDTIAPNMGFGEHPHENMEIITVPLQGVLKHRDSMHNAWQEVKPGEVQVMSAGTGVYHSEINGSRDESLKLFQIWIIPDKQGVEPRYDQKAFEINERDNQLQVLVSSMDDGHNGSLRIHQDAILSRINLSKDSDYDYQIKSKNHGVYVMVIDGNITVDNQDLKKRDAIGVWDAESFNIQAKGDSQILFIEVPMLIL
ncbi:pirin family protein [Mangrovimonas aestuarii]|uniref:pirin family protein n=1 Tax=Mangrovimonas aestuarii TaxID=3018443 RepID=UPI002377E25B|nr:pirin family protein [Mangrovimonas aestuarii]